MRVLQGLEQPVERPGPVVGEDDDPELGLRAQTTGVSAHLKVVTRETRFKRFGELQNSLIKWVYLNIKQ